MKKTSQLISAIMTLVLGVLFLIFKEGVIGVALTVLGIVLIVIAILELVRKNFTSGIIKAVLGVAVLIIGGLLLDIALIIVGIVLLVYGILELVKRIVAIVKKQNGKLLPTVLGFIAPAICIAASVLLLTGKALSVGIIIAGVLLIVDGIIALIEALTSKN